MPSWQIYRSHKTALLKERRNAMFAWGSLVTSIIKLQLILSTKLQLFKVCVYSNSLLVLTAPAKQNKISCCHFFRNSFSKKLRGNKAFHITTKDLYKTPTLEETSMLHFVRARLLARIFILSLHFYSSGSHHCWGSVR